MITEEIAAYIKCLPPFPSSVADLQTIMKDEAATLMDVERIIKPDPALTASLLKLANSAYFGVARKVDNVRHAAGLIGIKRIFDLATAVAYSRAMPGRLAGYDIDADDFLCHSVAVAVLGESLCRELGRPAPSLTFTAGLLHDVGKLAIGVFFAEVTAAASTAMQHQHLALVAAERALLATDHAEVGAAVADLWTLPEGISAVAGYHHNPDGAPDEHRSLVQIVHVANNLAPMLGHGVDIGELSRTVDANAIAALGVSVGHLGRVAAQSEEDILEMTKTFSGARQ